MKSMQRVGHVSLVGAGPGDPELITVRGLKRLQAADVVAYDRLVHPALLASAPEYAEHFDVGKTPGGGHDQHEIEQLIISHALRGKRVVRLKGGDPFVFGRGGEELAALTAAGIPVEIVPGITSAIAGPALAGIPVTHRDYSSSVTILTGHEDPMKSSESVEWDRLANTNGTLVILMGIGRIDAICSRLVELGRSPDTPAAVVAAASLSTQRSIQAPLRDLAQNARDAGISSPAVIVIGDVVRFSGLLRAIFPNRTDGVTASRALHVTMND